MRGGIDHKLVEMKVKMKSSERDLNDEEKRDRRILLALSWLSVESKEGAPNNHIVKKPEDALKEILKSRGVLDAEISQWVEDCSPSLSASIRDDAVWVNRSKAFDEAIGNSLNRDEVWDILEPFFGSKESYLKSLKATEDSQDNKEAQEEGAKDLIQKAGQWLSSRFGTGKGADFSRMADVYKKIAEWAGNASFKSDLVNDLVNALTEFNPPSKDIKGVLALISGPGYKSGTRTFLENKIGDQNFLVTLKEKAEDDERKCRYKEKTKGKRDYANKVLKDVEKACGFTYLQDNGPARHKEFAVILDHAARRVSLVHTWIKRAEVERRKFEEDAKKINQIPREAKEWLNNFCGERSETSGAIESYRIKKRAVDGWKEIVKAWSKQECNTEEDRIAAAQALQDDRTSPTFYKSI